RKQLEPQPGLALPNRVDELRELEQRRRGVDADAHFSVETSLQRRSFRNYLFRGVERPLRSPAQQLARRRQHHSSWSSLEEHHVELRLERRKPRASRSILNCGKPWKSDSR